MQPNGDSEAFDNPIDKIFKTNLFQLERYSISTEFTSFGSLESKTEREIIDLRFNFDLT